MSKKSINKILFVSHSNNLTYGAAKSLKAILNNIDCQFDFMCSKRLFEVYGDDGIIEYAGKKIDKIFALSLPFEDSIMYESEEHPKPINVFKKSCDMWLTRFRYLVDANEIERIICDGNYHVIHLNSIVLYPIISKRYNFVIHVREILSQKRNTQAKRKLEMASGIICIDEAAKESLPNINGNITVMNNPFDMTKVASTDVKSIKDKLDIDNAKTTIFAIVGVVNENKGIPFILECLKQIERQDISVLIVGSGPESTVKLCIDAAKNDKRIKYVGEMADIHPIYAICDYIIRADKIFGIGRTVYEGLYAGCDVIIPGDSYTDSGKMFERDVFYNRVHFYSPRNQTAFVKIVSSCPKVDKRNREVKSNIEEYVNTFEKFIRV